MKNATVQLGEFKLTAISDGLFKLDGGAMFGIVPKPLWEKVSPADKSNRIVLGLNCLLIETAGKNYIIDTGFGNKHDSKFLDIHDIERPPDLLTSLAEAGLSPADIDGVILTHLHYDHCGWNTVYNDEGAPVPTFPNAAYYVQKREWELANDPDPRSEGSYLAENFAPIAGAGQLRLIDGDAPIAPGIRFELTGGHSEGHAIVVIESKGETCVYLGDLIPSTFHLRIKWTMGFDSHPAELVAAKQDVLKRVVAGKWMVAFEHDPEHRLSRIEKDGGAYRFVPLE